MGVMLVLFLYHFPFKYLWIFALKMMQIDQDQIKKRVLSLILPQIEHMFIQEQKHK